ncbi:hypothetical protein M1M88_00890 [Peptococcaceae bacterium]|nr:hypothetical protein [Peptococcaceae bacterium]MCL0052566.1 hypothetical protein [Peptococcaceae bacterium]
MKLFVMALKLAYKRNMMNEVEKFLMLIKDISDDIIIIMTLWYLACVNVEFDLRKLVEIDRKLRIGRGEVIMTAAQKLIEEGRMEGRMEERIKIAMNMLKAELSMDIIQRTTGLSKEEIKRIKSQMKT